MTAIHCYPTVVGWTTLSPLKSGKVREAAEVFVALWRWASTPTSSVYKEFLVRDEIVHQAKYDTGSLHCRDGTAVSVLRHIKE